jgi:2-iminobutanoate/2-iminopropanoate deaminase
MVHRKAIIPQATTRPIGKYSPGILVPLQGTKQILFISGQVPSDDQGALIGGSDVSQQTEAVFANIAAILQAAGGDLGNLVSVTIYLSDMQDFQAVSAVRNRLMPDPPPASTLVEVSRLAVPGHRVEISGIAVIDRCP